MDSVAEWSQLSVLGHSARRPTDCVGLVDYVVWHRLLHVNRECDT